MEASQNSPGRAGIALTSTDTRALFETARALHRDQQWIEAARAYEAILAVEPTNHEVLHLIGLLSHQAGNAELALEFLHKAIQIEPNEAAYYVNFGSALQALEHLDVALDAYDVALELDPRSFHALNNRAHVRIKRGEKALAVPDLEAAIGLEPDSIASYFTLAACFEDLGEDAKAIEVYEQVVTHAKRLIREDLSGLRAVDPDVRSPTDDPIEMLLAAQINVALCLSRLGEGHQALAMIEAAIALAPDHPLANTTRAHCLRDVHRYEEALNAYQRACDLHQQSPESLVHLGIAYRDCLDVARAIACYDQALAKRKGWHEAIWNKCMALLLCGEYREGFALYEARWNRPEFAQIRASAQRLRSQSLLSVMSEQALGAEALPELLAGKRVLIFAEQSFGDSLQFCRFALQLKQLGASVCLHVPAALEDLMAELDPDVAVSSSSESIEAVQDQVDYHIALMSLPYALGLDLKQIATGPERYLKASEACQNVWAQAIRRAISDNAAGSRLIGIMWRGSQSSSGNARRRSLPLERFIEALQHPLIQLVSLQIDPSEHERELMQAAGVLSLHHEVQNFEDSAALAMQLDAVITVDTSVAHLCGGLGLPTWVLVPHRADWRWMLDREDSPWYPSIRLLRRPNDDDGSQALARALCEITCDLLRL